MQGFFKERRPMRQNDYQRRYFFLNFDTIKNLSNSNVVQKFLFLFAFDTTQYARHLFFPSDSTQIYLCIVNPYLEVLQ